MLDLDTVRAFVLVADLASFTRAADALGTTQSAVSPVSYTHLTLPTM